MNKSSSIILGLILGILIGGLGFWTLNTVRKKQAESTASASPHETKTEVSDTSTTGKKVVIGFSVPGTDHSWLGAIKRNAEEAASQFPDVELVLTDAQNSSEKQMADVESLIQRKVDVMIMLPQSGKALTPAAKKVADAKIPLVVLDRKIESEDYYTYLGGHNYGIGQAAAEFIGDKLGGKGEVAEVMGIAGISVTNDRHQGFVDTLKEKYPEIKIVSSLAADFSADKALTVTESILQAHPKIAAIYSHDDDMNVGVLRAVEQAQRKDIIITGAGGSKLMMEKIKAGDSPVKATFLYNPSMAGSAVNLARLIGKQKGMSDMWEPDVVKEMIVRASTVTQANADRFLKLGY